jgi:DNA-binding response OmpR family regulator
MAKRILIVDDEPRYLRLLEANLRTEGYEVVTAQDGMQAVSVFSDQPIDVMMPKLDGFGATQRIREFSSTPIIILTAKGDEQDRVRGLDLGADDYLVKPFSATELLARVRAVLRRAQPPTEVGQSRFFTHENLKIDFARAEVWRGETAVSLSATEYRLLLQFAHHVGKRLGTRISHRQGNSVGEHRPFTSEARRRCAHTQAYRHSFWSGVSDATYRRMI